MKQFVVFDTEFTAWEGSKARNWSETWEHRELIQLAAVKVVVSPQGLHISQSFNELVIPSLNPILSEYIANLTGISQYMLDEMGVDFSSAMHAFFQFCEDGELACYSWGNDQSVLKENCQLNHIPLPNFQGDFVNFHAIATAKRFSGSHLSSGELAEHLGIELEGHVHNALFDVKSLVAAMNFWFQKGNITFPAK